MSVARASGLDIDARRDHPTGIIDEGRLHLGDLPAVRAAPGVTSSPGSSNAPPKSMLASQSWTPWSAPSHPAPSATGPRSTTAVGLPASGVGIVEGRRGIVHRVEIGPDGRLVRVKVVDPSFFNWPVRPVAPAGTVVLDFPLVNRSFNFSYAGNDLWQQQRMVPRSDAGPHAVAQRRSREDQAGVAVAAPGLVLARRVVGAINGRPAISTS